VTHLGGSSETNTPNCRCSSGFAVPGKSVKSDLRLILPRSFSEGPARNNEVSFSILERSYTPASRRGIKRVRLIAKTPTPYRI